ncbi:PepSY domain-containing protein [Komagataeibacter sp. FXV2]|nr:PepSY domain-containing protein [Komagataeibacter sp. FXV2]
MNIPHDARPRRTMRALWPDYRMVWRWHFIAGLLCLPFVAFLSLTGSIYLFRPQIDDLIDWRYEHLATKGDVAAPSRVVTAALSAVPGSHFLAYELPRTSHSAVRVIVSHGGDAIRVYVDPQSLAILKQVSEEHRFERIIFNLHGQLLLGNAGSMIVEMVASWTIVLVVTGLYLWWPRGRTGRSGGIAYPRLAAGGRLRLRDLHAVTGAWLSIFVVLFLASGLPWSFVWGHALQSVEKTVGRFTAIQDWEIGHVSARNVIAGAGGAPAAMDAMAGMKDMPSMPGMDMPSTPAADAPVDGAALDRVVSTGATLGLRYPVLVTPPSQAGRAWRVRSDTQDRPWRMTVDVSANGHVEGRDRFADKPVIDRVIGYGVAAHEGQLFGIANQILNLVVAVGLLGMSIAAFLMWTRRRPPGHIGVPASLPDGRIGGAAMACIVVMGIMLPELGAALVVIILLSALIRPEKGSS